MHAQDIACDVDDLRSAGTVQNQIHQGGVELTVASQHVQCVSQLFDGALLAATELKALEHDGGMHGQGLDEL